MGCDLVMAGSASDVKEGSERKRARGEKDK